MKEKKSNVHSKKQILILFTLIIAALFIGFCFYYIHMGYLTKANFQRNITQDETQTKTPPFEISKIYLFSSAYANQNETANKSTWNLDLSQFTDIAIFVDNHSETGLNGNNTIRQLYIDSIQYTNTPMLGTPKLYYKNPNDFGKLSFHEEKEIQDTLNYTIIPYSEQSKYENPEVYDSNFSPICLGFVNQNIKTNNTITNIEEPLHYDGSLLKRCNIGLTRIQCSFSFDIHIINQLGKHFKSTVTIDIPLKDSSSNATIYDGFLKQEITKLENSKFYEI